MHASKLKSENDSNLLKEDLKLQLKQVKKDFKKIEEK